MDRQRVLLLENDGVLERVLFELFQDEGLDVTACETLGDLHACVRDYATLSPHHHAEIVALTSTAQVVLTTGRPWAKHFAEGALGTVAIVEKPYDLDRLLAAVQVALERASSQFSTPAAACAGV